MPDRASVFNQIQLGLETTPGTAVPALKLLQSLSIEPQIDPEIQMFGPSGAKFDTVAAMNSDMTTADVSGVATYSEGIYPLASVMSKVNPTNDGATAKLWDFGISQSNPDTLATYTVEQGSSVRGHRFPYGLFTAFGFAFSRKGVEAKGKMMGAALEDNRAPSTNAKYTLTSNPSPPTAGTFTLTVAGQTTGGIAHNATPAAVQAALEALSTVGAGNVTVTLTANGPTLAVASSVYTVEFVNAMGRQAVTMTGTFTGLTASGSIVLASSQTGAAPTALPLVPLTGAQWTVALADSFADLNGGTGTYVLLSRPMNAEWMVEDRAGPIWVGNGSTSFAGHVEKKPKLAAKLKVAADAEGMALLATLRANSTKFMRIRAQGADIEATKPYLLQIDLAAKVDKPSKFEDQDGLYAIEWPLNGVYDATWGNATRVKVRNTLASL
jgi:hypothetical protein